MKADAAVAPTTLKIRGAKKKPQDKSKSFFRTQLWKTEFTSTDRVVPKARILKPKVGVSSKQKEMLKAIDRSEAKTGIR